jgi:hypothetical protein
MSKLFFYNLPILPQGFNFPQSYLQLAQGHVIPDLQPWKFLFTDMPSSLSYYGAMLKKYPDKPLVPFAILDDPSGASNDGYVVLACFDGDNKSGDPKVYFHDYAHPKQVDWPDRYSLANFTEWLRVAQDESSRYKIECAED